MAHKVTLIPGDGIGPEVTRATVRILEATGVKFEWETFAVGAEAYEKSGEYIPKEVTESIERTRVGSERPSHNADRRRLRQHQRRASQDNSICMRIFARSGTCLTFRRAIPMSISIIVRENTEELILRPGT